MVMTTEKPLWAAPVHEHAAEATVAIAGLWTHHEHQITDLCAWGREQIVVWKEKVVGPACSGALRIALLILPLVFEYLLVSFVAYRREQQGDAEGPIVGHAPVAPVAPVEQDTTLPF